MFLNESYYKLIDLNDSSVNIKFMYDNDDNLIQVIYNNNNIVVQKDLLNNEMICNSFTHYIANGEHISYIGKNDIVFSYSFIIKREHEQDIRKVLSDYYIINVLGYGYVFVLKNKIKYFKRELINTYKGLLYSCDKLAEEYNKLKLNGECYI